VRAKWAPATKSNRLPATLTPSPCQKSRGSILRKGTETVTCSRYNALCALPPCRRAGRDTSTSACEGCIPESGTTGTWKLQLVLSFHGLPRNQWKRKGFLHSKSLGLPAYSAPLLASGAGASFSILHTPAQPSAHNSGISLYAKCGIFRIDCKPALRHTTTKPSWLRYRIGEPASLERAQAGYG